MQFPRLVYKSAEKYLLVENKEEMNSVLISGWYASVPEALAKKHEVEAVGMEGKSFVDKKQDKKDKAGS